MFAPPGSQPRICTKHAPPQLAERGRAGPASEETRKHGRKRGLGVQLHGSGTAPEAGPPLGPLRGFGDGPFLGARRRPRATTERPAFLERPRAARCGASLRVSRGRRQGAAWPGGPTWRGRLKQSPRRAAGPGRARWVPWVGKWRLGPKNSKKFKSLKIKFTKYRYVYLKHKSINLERYTFKIK